MEDRSRSIRTSGSGKLSVSIRGRRGGLWLAALLAVVLLAEACDRGMRTDGGPEDHADDRSPGIALVEGVTIVDLGTLGGCCSTATGINEAGHVVGWSTTSDGATHAFLWIDGTITDLGDAGYAYSAGGDIDDTDRIVGVTRTDQGIRGFRLEGERMVELDALPGGTSSGAVAINNAGQIVGESDNGGHSEAVLWTSEGIIRLHPPDATGSTALDINDAGDIVGFVESGGQYAFLWKDGVLTRLTNPSDARDSQALGINNGGQIVGRSRTNTSRSVAVLWRNGSPVVLGTEGATGSEALAIDGAGRVAGRISTPDIESRAVIWIDGRVLGLGTLGGEFSSAVDINDSGWIVGSATDVDGNEHATLWILRDFAGGK